MPPLFVPVLFNLLGASFAVTLADMSKLVKKGMLFATGV